MGESMKIGYDGRFITKDASGNGVFTCCLLEHLVRLDERNQYVIYFTYENSLQARENLRLRKMSRLHRSPHLRFLLTFPLELSRCPVDVFHAFYTVPIRVPAKVVLTLVEFFWFAHPERLPFSKLLLSQARLTTKHAVTRADIVIVPTYFVHDHLLDYFNLPEEKVAVIPLGLNEYFLQEPTPEEIMEVKAKYKLDRRYILTVGDLHKRKNFEALVDIFNRLKEKEGLAHRLIIVGKPLKGSQTLLCKIATSKFCKDILVTGYIPISHLRILYGLADLFVLPSLDEGFGLTTHEAMACRTPVVCSNRGALPEVVGDAAILFDPSGGEEMEQAILRVLGDLDLREGLIRRGLERIKHFSWEKIAKETLRIYGQLS
jgi:glycosyltransferase involved in cell wall biosynthesis